MENSSRNGFDSIVDDIVGDHVRKGKGTDWYRAGQPADMGVSYAVIMTSMRMGDILWEDQKKADLVDEYVVNTGIPDGVRPGYRPYSSVLLVDQDGLLCTFSGSNWGARNTLKSLIPPFRMQGQKAFPIVRLSSKARGNAFDTIDPVLQVIGWTPASKFEALIGAPPAIEAPKPAPKPASTPAPDNRSSADIVDDQIPF